MSCSNEVTLRINNREGTYAHVPTKTHISVCVYVNINTHKYTIPNSWEGKCVYKL